MKAVERKRRLASMFRSRLALAVRLTDDAKPDKLPVGEIYLLAEGLRRQPVMHDPHTYVFSDLPAAKFTVVVGGRLYQEETVEIDTTGPGPKPPFREITLKTKNARLQPQPQPQPPDTILKGRILDSANNAPIAGVQVGVKTMTMTGNAVTGADGGFTITFRDLDTDRKVTLSIKKEGYKTKEATILIKKEAVTITPDLKLAKK